MMAINLSQWTINEIEKYTRRRGVEPAEIVLNLKPVGSYPLCPSAGDLINAYYHD